MLGVSQEQLGGLEQSLEAGRKASVDPVGGKPRLSYSI